MCGPLVSFGGQSTYIELSTFNVTKHKLNIPYLQHYIPISKSQTLSPSLTGPPHTWREGAFEKCRPGLEARIGYIQKRSSPCLFWGVATPEISPYLQLFVYFKYKNVRVRKELRSSMILCEPEFSWGIHSVAHSVDKPIWALGGLYMTRCLHNQRYFRLEHQIEFVIYRLYIITVSHCLVPFLVYHISLRFSRRPQHIVTIFRSFDEPLMHKV